MSGISTCSVSYTDTYRDETEKMENKIDIYFISTRGTAKIALRFESALSAKIIQFDCFFPSSFREKVKFNLKKRTEKLSCIKAKSSKCACPRDNFPSSFLFQKLESFVNRLGIAQMPTTYLPLFVHRIYL